MVGSLPQPNRPPARHNNLADWDPGPAVLSRLEPAHAPTVILRQELSFQSDGNGTSLAFNPFSVNDYAQISGVSSVAADQEPTTSRLQNSACPILLFSLFYLFYLFSSFAADCRNVIRGQLIDNRKGPGILETSR